MKKIYQKPAMEMIHLHGRQSLLAASGNGVNAKISGYSADDEDGYGFK